MDMEAVKSWLWKGFLIQTVGAILMFIFLVIIGAAFGIAAFALIFAAIFASLWLLLFLLPLTILFFLVMWTILGIVIEMVATGDYSIPSFKWSYIIKGFVYSIAMLLIGIAVGLMTLGTITTGLFDALLVLGTNPIGAIISIPVSLLAHGIVVEKIGGN